MSYRPPTDPRLPWEWCPKCGAWYEITPDEYGRLPSTPRVGACTHDDRMERKLTELEVDAASQPAPIIAAAFQRLSEITRDALQAQVGT